MDEEPKFVEIPLEQLSLEARRGIVEAFVGREGTDYGLRERGWEEKVADVLRQLDRGEARIVFDPETDTTNILTLEELGRLREG